MYERGHGVSAIPCLNHWTGGIQKTRGGHRKDPRGVMNTDGSEKRPPRIVGVMAANPRCKNGNLRRKHRARLKAMRGECGICKGKLGAIHYDEPSDAAHPLSFVVDEKIPISRYRLGGYESREAAANDWNNLQSAHYICNARKSNKLEKEMNVSERVYISDGNW